MKGGCNSAPTFLFFSLSMERKHYIAKGLTSVSLSLLINGEMRRIDFNKGHRVGNAVKFASYATTDVAVQKALEQVRFPIISIDFVEHIDEFNGIVQKPKESEQAIEADKVFEEVKTMKEAIAVLTSEPYNLKAVQCNTKNKIQKKMAELRIAFPNIVYDL